MIIKLKCFETNIHPEEQTQDVRYIYYFKDGVGLMELNLTIPDNDDPVEQFIFNMIRLYKGINNYIIYHNKYKYISYIVDDKIGFKKVKMYN